MWVALIEELNKWHQGERHLFYCAASAMVISILMSLKDNKSWRYMVTSACICTVIALCFNVTLHQMGLNETYSAVAAVIETTAPDGYSGAIQLLVAADFHGKVYGTRVLEQHETPRTTLADLLAKVR